jgi:hypothetical protein
MSLSTFLGLFTAGSFAAFVLVVVYALTMPRRTIDQVSKLPLEDGP